MQNNLLKIPEEYDFLSGIFLYQNMLYLGLSDQRVLRVNLEN